MVSDCHRPISWTTVGSTSARNRAIAPPARRARALMSDSVIPKEAPMCRQLVRSATVRWLQVTFARRPVG
jgi:hypothetical protein